MSWGDTGKGKIVSYLSRDKSYDFVCRWAGGNNAGHTVFLRGKKYKTHLVPSGVFHGIKSVIGPACVVHYDSLMEEFDYLEEQGFDTSLVKVSPKAHIVTDDHIREDRKEFSPIGLVGKLRVNVGQTVGDRWIKMREISDSVHEYLVR